MTADGTEPRSAGSDGTKALLDGVERRLYGRREFITGLAVGGIAAAGALDVSNRTGAHDVDAQALATVAGSPVASRTRYYLPAVDSYDRGLIVAVDVRATEGTGDLFVNLDGVEVRHDLQFALREAVETATRFVGRVDAVDLAVTFSRFTPDDGVIALRGKSWEAGLTVAVVESVRRRSPGDETLVTGVVADDGTLLPVGGIEAKARAAREFGASKLLVPDGQETSVRGIRLVGTPSIASALARIGDLEP